MAVITKLVDKSRNPLESGSSYDKTLVYSNGEVVLHLSSRNSPLQAGPVTTVNEIVYIDNDRVTLLVAIPGETNL